MMEKKDEGFKTKNDSNPNKNVVDIGDNISTKTIGKIVINAEIRELDVYMLVKYHVCNLMKNDFTPPQIMDELKNLTTDKIRNAMSNLILTYGSKFQMPNTINSIPKYFNMFISDTTSRLVSEFVQEGVMGITSENNEGKASRVDQ